MVITLHRQYIDHSLHLYFPILFHPLLQDVAGKFWGHSELIGSMLRVRYGVVVPFAEGRSMEVTGM